MAKKNAGETAPVAKQYEKWVYPFPIQDLSKPEVRKKRDGGDYTTNWLTFWPNQEPREDLDVLIAGCGSNAAARYAFNKYDRAVRSPVCRKASTGMPGSSCSSPSLASSVGATFTRAP